MIPTPIVLGFVSLHTDRLRGAQVTVEQVCRPINARVGVLFCRRRGVRPMLHVERAIRYHQHRNAKAARFHKKKRLDTVINPAW